MTNTETSLTVTRITIASEQPYTEVVAKLESMLGYADVERQKELIKAGATPTEVKTAVESMLGSSGLMIVGKVDPGAFLSLLGKPKKAVLYILANPLVANAMFEVTSAVVEFAPLRLVVYEDTDGVAKISYEKPSTALSRFGSDAINAVAERLDLKLNALATSAAE